MTSSNHPVYEAVLHDVFVKIINESGPEIAALDWTVLDEACERAAEKSRKVNPLEISND